MKTFAEWAKENHSEEFDEGWKQKLGAGVAGLGIGLGGYMAGQNATPTPNNDLQNQSITSPAAKNFLSKPATELEQDPASRMKASQNRAWEWKKKMGQISAQRNKGTSKEIEGKSTTFPEAGKYIP